MFRNDEADALRLVTLTGIGRECGVSAATAKRWSELPSFPNPARSAGNRRYWLRAHIAGWLAMTNLDADAVALRAKNNHQEKE